MKVTRETRTQIWLEGATVTVLPSPAQLHRYVVRLEIGQRRQVATMSRRQLAKLFRVIAASV
jgi:hypothetical protein